MTTTAKRCSIIAAFAATAALMFSMLAFAATPAYASDVVWADIIANGKPSANLQFGRENVTDGNVYTVMPSGDTTGVTDRRAIAMIMEEASAYGLSWDHRNKPITIYLMSGKTYYINICFLLYNNVTINAKGATIKHTTNGKGFFINALYKDSRANTSAYKKIGGYNRCKNITINGGKWITTGKRGQTATKKFGWYTGYSSFLFMHGQNIKIKNLTITNNYNGHYIEFAGCKNVSVYNCTFNGKYVGDSTNEVIQLDTTYNASVSPQGAPWDGTPCKNVTIKKCKFYATKAPVGVGTNNACKKKSSNIKILKNKFKVKSTAINLTQCTKVTAKGNTFKKGYVSKSGTASKVTLGKAEKKRLR